VFESIIGQEHPKKIIGSMIETDRIPHALLFVGPYGVGKGEMALEMARMLLCSNGPNSGCSSCSSCIRSSRLEHPDLHVLFPIRAQPKSGDSLASWLDELINHRKVLAEEPYAPIIYEKSRQIVVGLVREVYERLLETSFEGGRKVCIILSAERLNVQTANSLLKILEEPPSSVHFLLTTERLSSVLPTIISRASVVRFRRLTEREIAGYFEKKYGIEPEKSSEYASLAEGSLKTAKAFISENKSVVLSRAFEIYKAIATGGPDEVIGQAFPFNWSRDVIEAEELIGGFALCTRYVLKKKSGLEDRNGEFADTVAALSDATDLKKLQGLSVKLEEGLEMLGRNVNVSTVITSIFYEIYDTYRY
jgi:DNA polymerase III delta' subunit